MDAADAENRYAALLRLYHEEMRRAEVCERAADALVEQMEAIDDALPPEGRKRMLALSSRLYCETKRGEE